MKDLSPNHFSRPSQERIEQLRRRLELEIEEAKKASTASDSGPVSLTTPDKVAKNRIAEFASHIHSRNLSFMSHCGREHKSKGSWALSGLGGSSYNVFGVPDTVGPELDEPNLTDLAESANFTRCDMREDVRGTNPRGKERSLRAKIVSFEEHEQWNRFLRDISDLTIEIDDDKEEFL